MSFGESGLKIPDSSRIKPHLPRWPDLHEIAFFNANEKNGDPNGRK